MSIQDDKRVNYGRATVPFIQHKQAWRLPCGKFTKDRNEAVNMAKRMDRIISGRAKYEGVV
jgi:hypothetical protein